MNLLTAKETLKNIAPQPLRKFIRNYLKKYRELKILIGKLKNKNLSADVITNTLKQLGITEGDTILVHSSLSRLGYVDGGAAAVVSALLQTVGPNGTVGVPTFCGNTGIYLAGQRDYNINSSPSILGVISETVRTTPKALRSLHPTHSASFLGPNAAFLVEDHHLDNTPIGGRSPYRRLVDIGGKIVLLNVTLEYLTNFHTIEDEVENFPFKVYLDEALTFNVTDTEGNAFEVKTYCHCPEMGKKRQCMKMRPYLLGNNVMKEAKLGSGTVTVLDAPKLHATLLDLYRKGITMYSPEGGGFL
jgi:aminoglycoside 3-N-acetyltransferase